MTWQYTLLGLLTGVLVGMTGMGGGSLMTPLLVFLFGVPPSTAIGTDIAHGAVFKSVGAFQHRRMGNVRALLAGWMLVGSVPASLIGVWVNVQLTERYGDDVESVMGQVLGGALLFGAVGLIAKSLVQKEAIGDVDWELTRRDRIAAVLIGVFGGFIVGLTSVGSGVFFGLTLLVVFPLRAHKVVGTDIFHAAVLLYVAGAAHWAAGNVDFGILSWLLLGSIPGVLIGGRLTLSIPERPLRLLLAGVLGLAGIKLLDVPGAGIIVVVALAAGATALLVWLGAAQLDPLPARPRSGLEPNRLATSRRSALRGARVARLRRAAVHDASHTVSLGRHTRSPSRIGAPWGAAPCFCSFSLCWRARRLPSSSPRTSRSTARPSRAQVWTRSSRPFARVRKSARASPSGYGGLTR